MPDEPRPSAVHRILASVRRFGALRIAACVGVAGAALVSFYYVSPEVGSTFALIAYVVVALGGFGSVPGALLGGIVVGLVEITSPVIFGVPPNLKYAVVFSIYLLVVFVRPQGLLGRF